MFHARVLKEINLISNQKLSAGCTNEFRPNVSWRLKLINTLQVTLNRLIYLFSRLTKKYITSYKPSVIVIDNNNYFVGNLDKFESCFNLLSDEESKQRYVSYIAYHYVKSYSTRLPFDYEAFSKYSSELKAAPYHEDKQLLEVNFVGKTLFLPNSIYGLVINYKLEQYAYDDWLKADDGDIVLDCGGADGDTALYFAAYGAKHVYSFEFLASNVERFKDTLSNNNKFAENITIVQKALWDKSGIRLAFEDNGNASTVSEQQSVGECSTETITIDEFLETQSQPVNYIKMDIEGAELKALEGAVESIKKYKPKLAICVYHKDRDLIDIPNFINSLSLGYKFKFDYYTDTGAEAVLYAKVES